MCKLKFMWEKYKTADTLKDFEVLSQGKLENLNQN